MLNRSNLHGYQNASVEHVKKHPFCGLFLDMGLGKTVSSLTAIADLVFNDLEVTRVLVVAPKRVASNVWSDEIHNWEHLKHIRYSRVIGTVKQRQAALKEDAEIYLIGRDNIAWLCGQYGGSMLPFDMLVIDESSSFKNPKSIRFKALKQVIGSIGRVVLLTGTPAPNGLIDLWSQIYLLDRGERLGKTITEYRRELFRPDKTNGHIVFSYKLLKGSEQKIHKAIGDICISMKSEDYLDLPEVLNKNITIEFPKSLQDRYDEFEKEKVLGLLESQKEGEEVTALSAAALSNKLLQFANGAIYDSEKNWHEVHDLKIKEVENIIEEAQGKPVLVGYSYKHDLFRLQERLKKYSPRTLTTDQDIEDWNAGKIRVMLLHPAGGGHGLNLQHGGNLLVWFGLTWSLELYQQLNKRLPRQGQTQIVTIYKLIASKTMDEDVVASNENKTGVQNGLLNAVKARISKYL